MLEWLIAKLGKPVITLIIDDVLGRFIKWLGDLWTKWVRKTDQDKATKVIEENIEKKSIRDEKTRKDEEDFLNS